MTFLWPYVLLALPIVLAGLLILFISSQRARRLLLAKFAAPRLLPMLLNSYSPAMRQVKHVQLTLGALLVVLALARPQWGFDWQEQHVRGVDVVFVIDTSKSMLSEDVHPNRLERAKLAIMDCVQKMAGNRVGLVAFAGDAFLQCPLTLDYDAFRLSLEDVDTHTINYGGTNIGGGLEEAATALKDSGNHKIIVLLTDGEDLEAQGVDEAKKLAKDNVTVYTVGVGTPEGELIPLRDKNGQVSYLRDDSGQIVKSRLDSKTLSDIAEATSGFYQPLGQTGDGLMKIYEDGIKKIPERELTSRQQRQPIERFQWPLGLGIILLTVEMLIGTRRPNWLRRGTLAVNLTDDIPPLLVTSKQAKAPAPARPPSSVRAAILLLVAATFGLTHAKAAQSSSPSAATDTTTSSSSGNTTSGASASSEPAPDSKSPKVAQNLFQKGNYKAAAEVYGRAADASPLDWRMRYNQGISLYRSEDFDGAANAFTQTLGSSSLPLQEQAYYNLGNAHYRLGQAQQKDDPKQTIATWEKALKDYDNALELNQTDKEARDNHDLVKQQLDELKKEQEKKDQQQQQQDQQNQDQNQHQDQKQDQSQNQPKKSPDQKPQDQKQSPDQKQSQDNKQSQDQQQSQNQQDQKQNQSDQKSSSSQSQQNQNGQKNPDGSSQQNEANGGQKPDQQNASKGQDQQPGQNSSQNQPQNQNSGQKPGQDKSDQQNSGQNQTSQPGQNQPKSGDQSKNGSKPQAQPSPEKGTEPGAPKTGQTNQQNANSGGAAGGTSGNQTGNATVSVAGGMTVEEARMILDSLKTYERKLQASPSDQKSTNNQPGTDQPHKDW